MSKRSVFTTISPLPAGISREVVVDFLQNHVEMIDLNPLVKERHPINPPPEAPDDEIDCVWYSLTDRITYLPGGLASGDVSYTCAFHDLPTGIQTHCRAPLNVDIRDKWTLNGTLPGEPAQPVELGIGAPATGLYIREDVDLRCNILMTSFVKKNIKRSHVTLVDRLVERAKLATADASSIRTSRSSWAAVQEQQVQPWAASRMPQPRATDGAKRRTAQRARSPPPQLGSPFVAGYHPGRSPSLRYPSPLEDSEGLGAPATITASYRSHSQPGFESRAQPCGSNKTSTQDSSSVPSDRQPQHYPRPPAAHHHSALYPQPLRLRNTPVGSGQLVSQQTPGAAGGYATSCQASTSSGSARAADGRSSALGSRSSSEHPDYPQLNPYSGPDSSPDEPPPPRTPQFIAELPGSDGLGGGCEVPRVAGVEHPAVLRPGRCR